MGVLLRAAVLMVSIQTAGASEVGAAIASGKKPAPTGGCVDDTWTATTSVDAPSARREHTAVWTRAEMIVWGGTGEFPGGDEDGISGTTFLNTGGRYDPATDTWSASSTLNAPRARRFHSAVWTDSEMIVWGGSWSLPLDTGGRYDPATDTWETISTVGAPSSRWGHTAVWTGSEMIVWGGIGEAPLGTLNTGGRYDPATDTWVPTSTVGAPRARAWHTAVWTGKEMIVWGGDTGIGSLLYTGGRYDPATDSWVSTTIVNTPSARRFQAAVWTDTEMIVWGGQVCDVRCGPVNSGGRYDPATDSWVSTTIVNAPSARFGHAIWTGAEMIVWGGSSFTTSGGRYDPAADAWLATSTAGAPSARESPAMVWTGTEMIVWGGVYVYFDPNIEDYVYVDLDTGGYYCASSLAEF